MAPATRGMTDEQLKREAQLRSEIEAIYEALTDGFQRSLRLDELVTAAAEQYPGLVPTAPEMEAERRLPQRDKQGLEIDQGIFLAQVLAHPRCGAHLVHAMAQPKREALEALAAFRRAGTVDLGPVRVDRQGPVGVVTLQNHAFLNAEDEPQLVGGAGVSGPPVLRS